MYVKKRMSLLLFAALAMVLFTACGRWDFSREAAKAANEAQGANPVVTFDTSRALTDALRDAAAENVQPADIEAALKADDTLAELLAGRSVLDVRFAAGDQSADDAAAAIAAQLGRLTGRKPDAFIAMVKADNGWFYAAVVTTPTGGSGSDDGNGGNDPGTTPGEDEGENPGEDETKTYTVTVDNDIKNGNVSLSKKSGIKAGETITITPDANNTYDVQSVTATKKNGGGTVDVTENKDGTYSVTVNEDLVISAIFVQSRIENIELLTDKVTTGFDIGDSLFYDRFFSDLPENWDDFKDWDLIEKKLREGLQICFTYENGDTDTIDVDDSVATQITAFYERLIFEPGDLFYRDLTSGFVKAGNQKVLIQYSVEGYDEPFECTVIVDVTIFDYDTTSVTLAS